MTTTAWLVIFPLDCPAPAPPAWWARPLRPGWRHCLAACPDGQGSQLVEHIGSHLVARHVPQPIGALAVELQESLTAMVLLVPPLATPKGASWRPFMTCVEAVKAAIGLRAWWVLTPYALFRHLRRLGAHVVLPHTSRSVSA
jgi:hypothetical protein